MESRAKNEAVKWLQNELDGDVDIPAKKIFAEAKANGFSQYALRMAQKNLKVRTYNSGFHKGWVWTLRKEGGQDA